MILSTTSGISPAENDGPMTLPSLARIALPAAERDLVELGVVLVDTEHADVADVVVTASVHAAGDVEVDIADVEQIVEVVETRLDCGGDRDRFGVGQIAEVATRATNDAGQQADVRCRQTVFPGCLPDRIELGFS
jgi:hypothetical protein